METLHWENEAEVNDDYEDYDNSDELYESWRDDWGSQLADGVQELYNNFVNSKDGYFKNKPEQFVRDLICDLLFITKTKIKIGKFGQVEVSEEASIAKAT